ncbi:zf-HC2 domain-containing protein [Streptomyces abikoensis]
MTSMTGTDGHPEVAEISALAEGVLSPARTADVREHLAVCELCEDVRSSLDEIRGALGTLPGPPRMPADIAGRIDAALAAEALLDSTTPPHGVRVPVSRETEALGKDARGKDARGKDARGKDARGTAPLSAYSAVSRETPTPPAGSSVSRETQSPAGPPVSRETPVGPPPRETAGRPANRSRSTAGPGRQAPPPRKTRSKRARHWPTVLLASACVAAVISAGAIFLQSGGTDAPRQTPAQGGESRTSAPALASGDLTTRVQELLKPSPFSANESRGKTAESPETPPGTLSASNGTVPLCVRQGTGRTEEALISEQETYRGEDAYLLVLPHPGDVTLVDAYVVSATCVDAGGTAPGKVLLTETLPRA